MSDRMIAVIAGENRKHPMILGVSGFSCAGETNWISSAAKRKKLAASRSVVSAPASEQQRRSVTFCGEEE